jgi:uncharacterized protein YjdB
MTGAVVSWSSLAAGVAAVDATGRVTAKAVGTARIVAASGSLADTATVVVRQVVASVAVSPAAPVVQEGATQQVSATARDANGNAIAGVAFTWTSSNTAAATVNGSGLVSGVAAGVSYVTASAAGKNAVATVTVAAPPVATVAVTPGSASIAVGATVNLDAVARDASARILTGRAVTWATSNPAVATVSSTGLVTGVAGGAATITATSEGKSGTATVTVTAPAGASLAFQDGFESGTMAAVSAGYRWNGAGNTVSRDIARSGAYSLKFLYTGASRCDDGWSEQRFVLGEDLKEVWIEYYLYLPNGQDGLGAKFYHRETTKKNADGTCSNTVDVSNNNKFLRLWDVDYNNFDVKAGFEYRRSTGGVDGDSYLYGMYGSDTRPIGDWGVQGGTWNSAITDATRGRWVQIRVRARLADSKTAANGVLQLWADGVLRVDMRNLDMAAEAGANNFFRNGYLMGWSNSGFNQNTAVYVDDFKIFRASPGW